jgi:tRNA pseudouridine32 synthase/23S rRNA pseudouridine746 synthase
MTAAPPPLSLLTFVHVEQSFAVVDKPSGLLSCPGRGADKWDSVQTRVPQLLPHATGPILAHRLDQPTSGLLLVALDAATHRLLRLQFEARSVRKTYVAELVGEVQGDSGELALPFRLELERRPLQIHDPVFGKVGVTRWRVLARRPGRTRVELVPLTGRTHQLRTHMAHPAAGGGLGCPIAGDALYGDPTTAPRLLLHAHTLAFVHPHTGEAVRFTSPLPF